MSRNVFVMKRVLVMVVVLTLVGGGIAFAIADSGSPPPIAQARIEGQTTAVVLADSVATVTETPVASATPDPTDAPETPVDEAPQTAIEPETIAEDSGSSSSQAVLQPEATVAPALTQADTLAQNALLALKQFLASPDAKDTIALTTAVKALDGTIAQIQALGLPLEQQQSEVAVLLLARAHILELMTQIASQTSSHPKPTPTTRRSSSRRSSSFFLGGSRDDVPNVVSGFQSAPGQP